MVEKRLALLIGNSAYPDDLHLKNPANDARALAAALEPLRFDVSLRTDLRCVDMKDEIAAFVKKLEGAGPCLSLFYFAGHAFQDKGQNWLVPVDATESKEAVSDRLIHLQEVIDKISGHSDIRLVLLDACRVSPDDDEVQRQRRTRAISGLRALMAGGAPVSVQGLANMRARQNTFIAFAAAPGEEAQDEARDGDANSPFVTALLKHIGTVDLPLSNLMSRVRLEVARLTKGFQRTWDESSLDAPFYFNAGNLLLFIGNMMALIGLLLALVPYSLVLASGTSTPLMMGLAGALPAVALLILLFGMNSVYSRLLGSFRISEEETWTLRNHFMLSLQKGCAGGYLGALIASGLISIPYYYVWKFAHESTGRYDAPDSLGATMVEIAVAAALTACILGTLSIFFTRVRLAAGRLSFDAGVVTQHILVGSTLGGAIAGVIAAPLLTAYFGRLYRPEMTPGYLLPGSIIGSAFLIFAIVNFDYERLDARRIGWSAIASFAALACGAAVAAVIFACLYLLGIVGFITTVLETRFNEMPIMLLAGAAYGLPVGVVLGITIGAAIILTQRWTGKPVV